MSRVELAARRKSHLSIWPLRTAIFLFAIGTAKYVERDTFHNDDSQFQPIVEITSVILGMGLSLGVALRHRTELHFRPAFLLLNGTLALAVISSWRSWDPLFSATRAGLLIIVSVSVAALVETYGMRPLLRSLVNAYVILILLGVVVGMAAPEAFPLMQHDPGRKPLRARLHLFRIHPIALADDCVISLIASVMLAGRWIRACRFILVTCLMLTVTRASILIGLPLYAAAEFLFARSLAAGFKRLCSIGGFAVITIVIFLSATALLDDSNIDRLGQTIVHIVDATEHNVTLNGRTTVWRMLIADLSWDNVYGYGVGGARYYLLTINPWFSQSHNSALETIYMSGYLGLAAMMAALLNILSRVQVAGRVVRFEYSR